MLTENIDRRPNTGTRNVKGKLKIKTDDWLLPYFNGAENYDQVKNITVGKSYSVIRIEGFGDCEDVTIINDIGVEQTLADFFFEPTF